jgi:hypothetical protein
VHRLDRISAKKPAKLLDSKSLTLGFSRKQIWPVFLPYRSKCPRRPPSWLSAFRTQVGLGIGRAGPFSVSRVRTKPLARRTHSRTCLRA